MKTLPYSTFGLEPCSSRSTLVGDRFGRLTVLGFGKKARRVVHAICRCDCGNLVAPVASNMKRGTSTSCGCYRKEVHPMMVAITSTKHGLSRHRLYATWTGMHNRCYDETHIHFASYGGRGIFVCERWHDVKSFVLDMAPSHKSGLQLDRIDNDGPYSPENCRWASAGEQGVNKRTNKLVTFKGKTQPLCSWSRELNIPTSRLSRRLSKGWPLEQVFNPLRLDCAMNPLKDQ